MFVVGSKAIEVNVMIKRILQKKKKKKLSLQIRLYKVRTQSFDCVQLVGQFCVKEDDFKSRFARYSVFPRLYPKQVEHCE